MKKFWQKSISFVLILGIFLSYVFSPFFAQKVFATAKIVIKNPQVTPAQGGKFTLAFEIETDEIPDGREAKVDILEKLDPNTQGVKVLSDSPVVIQNNRGQFQSQDVLKSGYTYTAVAKILGDTTFSPSGDPVQNTITSTQDITIDSNQNVTIGGGQASYNPGSSGQENTDLPSCSFPYVTDMGGCFARVLYWILFIPTSFLFSLSGMLMDFSMAYTLDSTNYGKTSSGESFVEKGWTITRDLSNLLFIIMLLWIAIGTILGLQNVNAKKQIGTIVLVGLLINFSLFFARFIIDGSNILAKIFYDSMEADTSGVYNPWIGEGDKSISIAIVSRFDPKKLFALAKQDLKLKTNSGVIEDANAPSAAVFILITIIMSIINLVGMYIFFVIAFVMFGRVIGLWLLMIFAPVAFISYLMPKNASEIMDQMHHSKWWPSLIKQSFLVPIFLFFLYLILLFMNTDFLRGFRQFDNSSPGAILNVVVPLILVVVLLLKAKSITVKMSGDIGQAFAKAGSAIGGLALGGAVGMYGKIGGAIAGQTARIGRGTIGRAGERLAESETFRRMSEQGNFLTKRIGKNIVSVGEKASSASFDVRGLGVVQKYAGNYVGKGKTGGWEQDKKYKEKELKDRHERYSEVGIHEAESVALREARLSQENHRNSTVDFDYVHPVSGAVINITDVVVRKEERRIKEEIEKAEKKISDLKKQGLGNSDAEIIAQRDYIREMKAAQEGLKNAINPTTGRSLKDEENLTRQAEKNLKNKELERSREFADKLEKNIIKSTDTLWQKFGKLMRGGFSDVGGGISYSSTNTAKTAEQIRKGIKREEN